MQGLRPGSTAVLLGTKRGLCPGLRSGQNKKLSGTMQTSSDNTVRLSSSSCNKPQQGLSTYLLSVRAQLVRILTGLPLPSRHLPVVVGRNLKIIQWLFYSNGIGIIRKNGTYFPAHPGGTISRNRENFKWSPCGLHFITTSTRKDRYFRQKSALSSNKTPLNRPSEDPKQGQTSGAVESGSQTLQTFHWPLHQTR